MRLRFRAGTS